MGDEITKAQETLGNDAVRAKSTHDWSTFITDLQNDLKDPKILARQKEIRDKAEALLKDAGFGELKIDKEGVVDGKILEHKGGKAYAIDGKGQEAEVTTQPPPTPPADGSNQRDAQNRVTTNDSQNTYGYDDKGLNSVTWTDGGKEKGFKKNPPDATHPNGQWVDADGKPFKDGGDPVVDQKTGDLTYQKGDSPTQRTEKADGGTVDRNDKGAPVVVWDKDQNKREYTYDADGKLTGVDYTAKGATDKDPKQSWTKGADNTWTNSDTPPQTRKDISVDAKTGDYTEISADGTKKHVEHTSGPATDGDNTPDQPPAPPQTRGKSAEAKQWWADRPGAVQKIHDDSQTAEKVKIPHGGAMWDVAKESLIKHGTDPHDPHLQTKIYNEVLRLAKSDKNKDVFGDLSGKTDAQILAGPASHLKAGTEIDISPDAPPPPAGPTVKYDAADTDKKYPTEVDYPNKAKAVVERDPTDHSVKTVTVSGTPDGKDFKVEKQPDNTYTRTNADGSKETGYQAPDVNADGTITLTRKVAGQPDALTKINPDGTITPPADPPPKDKEGADHQKIHYDGMGTDEANVQSVEYPPPSKVKATITPDADGKPKTVDVTDGDPANGGTEYKLVRQANGTYQKQDGTGKAVDPAVSYYSVDVNPDDGSITMVGAKDGHDHTTTINTKGETVESTETATSPAATYATGDKQQVLHYDGKGTDPTKNITDITYNNGMKATMSSPGTDGTAGVIDVTGDPGSSAEYKLVRSTDGKSWSVQDADGNALNPPKTYDTVVVGADGTITLTGGGKTTTIKPDGTTTGPA